MRGTIPIEAAARVAPPVFWHTGGEPRRIFPTMWPVPPLTPPRTGRRAG